MAKQKRIYIEHQVTAAELTAVSARLKRGAVGMGAQAAQLTAFRQSVVRAMNAAAKSLAPALEVLRRQHPGIFRD